MVDCMPMIAPAPAEFRAVTKSLRVSVLVAAPPQGAKITMDAAKISLEADQIALTAKKGVVVESADGNTTIKGVPKVLLNP